MYAAIVPVRRGDSSGKVLSELHRQGLLAIAVRDRCSVDCSAADIILDSSEGDGFMAGKCRDIGLDFAVARGVEGVIFVDEDCIPQESLAASHIRALSRGIPVISLGRRLESSIGWKDPRETGEAGNWHLFSGKGSVVQNVSWVKNCLATWTCNLGINMSAIRILRRAMKGICGQTRLFHPAFDGHWGGEDAYLGYLAWMYRVTMAYLPMGANAVKHIDHPRPLPEYGKGFRDTLEAQVEKLRKYGAMHPVSLDDVS